MTKPASKPGAKPSVSSDALKNSVKNSALSRTTPNEDAIAAQASRDKEAESQAGEGEVKQRNKPGPKPGSKKITSTFVKPGSTPEEKAKRCRAVGMQIADLIILGGMTLGGDDWKPVLNKATTETGDIIFDERENLRTAWADMAEYYGWEKVPAWLGASLATVSYAAPRFMAASTQSRWQKFKKWIADRKKQPQGKEEPQGQGDGAEKK